VSVDGILKNNRVGLFAYAARRFILAICTMVRGMRTRSDWEQDGVRAVEIVSVSESSSAQLAGLRRGYVITQVNGVKVRSTQELDNVLARLQPGSRVSIGYFFRSNLGWMPTEAVVILSK
jgi:predicted metalloprotease with PDZ domain